MAEQNDSIENDAVEEQKVAQAEPEATAETADTELERLSQELAEAKEQAMRMAAEAQNQRRRAERDIENANKFALERFAGALLTVADNLERATLAADPDNEVIKPLLDGVQLTYKGLIDVLSSFNVEQVDPEGEPFDPELHQAITMVENPAVEPSTVLQVMQKGYTLNGRLLRAAMVVVSRGPASSIDEQA